MTFRKDAYDTAMKIVEYTVLVDHYDFMDSLETGFSITDGKMQLRDKIAGRILDGDIRNLRKEMKQFFREYDRAYPEYYYEIDNELRALGHRKLVKDSVSWILRRGNETDDRGDREGV